MIPPASPAWKRARSSAAALRASWPIWKACWPSEPLSGPIGIGHTRWATHGVPNEINAHPHATKLAAVVHNGIIENFLELRTELTAAGHHFETETDSEAIVQLITHYLAQGNDPETATAKTLARLDGAFALAFLFADHPDLLIAARKGSPLAIGYGDGEMYIGSDALALAPLTRRITYLQDGDWAVLRADGVQIFDAGNKPAQREIRQTAQSGALIGKDGHRHYMHKEIHEQPQVIGDTLNTMLNQAEGTITLPELPFALKDVSALTIIACGTSYYAGLVAKYWIETLARLPVEVDVASEFRYRAPPMVAGRHGPVHFAIGRNRRHAGGSALLQGTAPASGGAGQCTGKHHRPRSRCGVADLRRPRDRRRLDQGLHHPAYRAGRPGDRHRPCARRYRQRRPKRVSARPCPRCRRAPPRSLPTTPNSRPSPRIWRRPATCSIWAAAPAIRSLSKGR